MNKIQVGRQWYDSFMQYCIYRRAQTVCEIEKKLEDLRFLWYVQNTLQILIPLILLIYLFARLSLSAFYG